MSNKLLEPSQGLPDPADDPSPLFQPLTIGRFQLKHRIVMAPLTRLRADGPNGIPNALMAEYYAQRATDGGLIIAEAAPIDRIGRSHHACGAIDTDEAAHGWKRVTDAVHARGGVIACQLWQCGRQASREANGDQTPIAPSAIQAEGHPAPRAIEHDEYPDLVQRYVDAAKRAINIANFDLVEIHNANGYILDQHLASFVNQRDDEFGGPDLENRMRFPYQVVEGVVRAVGADRTGLRLSPFGVFGDIDDADRIKTYGTFMQRVAPLNLAYIHLVEPVPGHPQPHEGNTLPLSLETLREHYYPKGVIIGCGGYTPQRAVDAVRSRGIDAAAFGRWYISNPDIVYRIRNKLPFNAYHRETFYLVNDPKGYTDYDFADKTAKDAVAKVLASTEPTAKATAVKG
ncbi:hypothetical protein CXG81DRAFT_26392 [Caulochytrium protostelioides]|uniref:NADH:flavin oxidoreductase/NADH oxidase N-terminal domain-containing protein n=1 Tax=Caulochytrium protostelioides TaxID=1555241 RepID=A0A4P9X6S8_9FUNG|nr:hypothetical protein CXG81DRAFT_26392 [Caulochytrium protostelioides]|eukprot:RKP00904.1 hypothetical protein CXG81DRAFT_26392 [Caulochytrium protostelioides]